MSARGGRGGMTPGRAPTGIEGLDEVLRGGFRRGAVHVIEGDAGTGKTTLALQFARAGARIGETSLFFSFSETVSELREIKRSHGWTDDGVDLRYFNVQEDIDSGAAQTMLEPGELYLPKMAQIIRKAIDDTKPERLVIDSLSDLRLVSQDLWLFRSQLVQLREALAADGRTALLLDSMTEYSQHLRTLASGIVHLQQSSSEFGPARRSMEVVKMRACEFETGRHDFCIRKGGIQLYPRFSLPSSEEVKGSEFVSSGIEGLDALVGGGLDRGSSVLLLGPAGAGKSLLATQYAASAAGRGETANIYLFDERLPTFFRRARGVGLDLESQKDRLSVRRVDPGEMTTGEFGWRVRKDVEQRTCSLVVIDSLSGYFHSMPNEHYLTLHLQELLTFLSRIGVITLLVVSEHGAVGSPARPTVDLSYLTDSVLLFRYFEHRGEMCRALSVYKKRAGHHERLIRELRIGSNGIQIGEPLRHFRGILTGFPVYEGENLEGESR